MWNGDVTGMGKKLKGNACSAFVIIQLKKGHCISSNRKATSRKRNQKLSDFPHFLKMTGETCSRQVLEPKFLAKNIRCKMM